MLTTAIAEDDGTASVDLALETAAHYKLKAAQARTILREVGAAVAQWRTMAAGFGLAKNAIERMASTFEHDDLAKATGSFETLSERSARALERLEHGCRS